MISAIHTLSLKLEVLKQQLAKSIEQKNNYVNKCEHTYDIRSINKYNRKISRFKNSINEHNMAITILNKRIRSM